MRFMRKNKYVIIAIIVLIVFIIGGMQLKKNFVPDEGKAAYGNRLEKINDHKLSKNLFTKIEENLKGTEKVLAVSNYVHGKIINLIITVKDEIGVEEARNIANSTIPMFENEELNFYSLQVYVKKENPDLNNFPIIGYKGNNASSLIFTKDREIVTGENNE